MEQRVKDAKDARNERTNPKPWAALRAASGAIAPRQL